MFRVLCRGVNASFPRVFSSALRRSISVSSISRLMLRLGMSISMRSPFRTNPMFPPAAASGEICPMESPDVPPEKRPSVMRAQALPRCFDLIYEVG